MCVNPTKEHGTKTKNTMQYTRLAKTLKHLVPSVILWLQPRHMQGPGKGVNLELQLPAYSKAPPTPGPSHTAAGGTTGPSSH